MACAFTTVSTPPGAFIRCPVLPAERPSTERVAWCCVLFGPRRLHRQGQVAVLWLHARAGGRQVSEHPHLVTHSQPHSRRRLVMSGPSERLPLAAAASSLPSTSRSTPWPSASRYDVPLSPPFPSPFSVFFLILPHVRPPPHSRTIAVRRPSCSSTASSGRRSCSTPRAPCPRSASAARAACSRKPSPAPPACSCARAAAPAAPGAAALG